MHVGWMYNMECSRYLAVGSDSELSEDIPIREQDDNKGATKYYHSASQNET